MKRSDQVILQKMTAYCEDIDMIMDRFGRSFSDYEADIAYQYAVSMCVIQIGELVSRLSEETLAAAKHIPWRAIRGMRNIYAHNYEKTKPETVWQTLIEDIPDLKKQLQTILDETTEDE